MNTSQKEVIIENQLLKINIDRGAQAMNGEVALSLKLNSSLSDWRRNTVAPDFRLLLGIFGVGEDGNTTEMMTENHPFKVSNLGEQGTEIEGELVIDFIFEERIKVPSAFAALCVIVQKENEEGSIERTLLSEQCVTSVIGVTPKSFMY